jgi:alpha-tubulin suppressor-like RCC1 family protein
MPSSTPVEVSGLSDGVIAVSAGYAHTCAVTTGGGAKCWGWNVLGQLGNGTMGSSSMPVDVSGLSSGVAAVSSGGYHSCALMENGGVKCWGWNAMGQLGNGTAVDSTTPVDVAGLNSDVLAVSTAFNHTCVLITGGGVKCWGVNSVGQLGNGTSTGPENCPSYYDVACSTSPVDVGGLTTGAAATSVGGGHACAVTTEGGVKCWGFNEQGQLGNGTTAGPELCESSPCSTTPVDVLGLGIEISAVDSGGVHTCALTAVGDVRCWGWNGFGQLGNGTTMGSSTPVDILGTSPTLDSDSDGCLDKREVGNVPALGGQRHPLNFWDFFDTPDTSNIRDEAVAGTDFFRILARFGAAGDNQIDPLSMPPPAPAYHTAFDRGASSGPNPWNLTAADGSIAGTDFFAVLAQFGHSCA